MANKNNLTITINANNEQFKKRLAEAKLETEKLQKNFGKLTKASGIAFTAISAALTGTVLAFRGFQKDFTQVITLLDKSSFAAKDLKSGIAGLKQGVLELRAASGESFETLNKGLFDLISAGVPAEQAIQSLRSATELAAAGGTDVATAVDAITTSINAFGLEAEDATEISQKFFLAQKNGKTTVAELSNSLGVAASNANSFGVSLDEVLAATAATTLAGKSTSQALTGLNQVFANIAKPTADAAAEAERLGIQFDSAALRSKGLGGFLNDLVNAEGFTSASIEKLFGSVEAMGVAFALTGEQNKDFNSTLKQLQDEAKLAETFNKALAESNATVDKAFAKLGGSIQAVFVTLGSKFAPIVIKVAESLTNLAKTIQGSSDRTLTIIKNTTIFAAALAGLATVIGTVGLALIPLRNGLKALGVSFAFTGNAARLFWIAVSGPIGKIVTGIGLVVAATVSLSKAFAKSPEKDLKKITKELSKIEEKERGLQAVIETGSEKQSSRAQKRLTALALEKQKLEEIRNELSASISKDQVGALLEERKVKIQELQTEQGKLAEQVLAQDGAVSERAATRLTMIDEEIAKLRELNEVASQGGGGGSEGEAAPAEEGAQEEGDSGVEKARAASEEKVSIAAQETNLKIENARREAEVLREIKAGASEEEVAGLREKNALIAEEEAIKLQNELLNAEKKTEGLTEQRELEIEKQLELNELELENLVSQKKLLNEVKEEDRIADQEANALIREIEEEENIKFNEQEIKMLKAQMKGKKEITDKFLLDTVKKKRKVDAQFLKDEKALGTKVAKMQAFFRSEEGKAVSKGLNDLASLRNAESKKAQRVGKAAAIAEATINTFKSATAAFSAMAGIPIVGPILGAVAAAAAVAAGFVQIQNIKSTPISGAVKGGLVQGGVTGQDTEPFMLAKGESVIPANITPELFNTFEQLKELKSNGGLISSLAKATILQPALETTTVINEENIENVSKTIEDTQDELEPQQIMVDVEIQEDAADFITAQQRENEQLGIGIL
jgi:TP901 family phage tail tape measure protein